MDSISYFQMKLSALLATFDSSKTAIIGCFPHFFNRYENAKYCGLLPDAQHYSMDSMSTSKREQLLLWYREISAAKAMYGFRSEVVAYYCMDVRFPPRSRAAFTETRAGLLWLLS